MNKAFRIISRLGLFLCFVLSAPSSAYDLDIVLDTLTNDLVIHSNSFAHFCVSGELKSNYKITVGSILPNAGVDTVHLRNAYIHGYPSNTSHEWAGINCISDCVIIFEGRNVVESFHKDYPGIHISENHTLSLMAFKYYDYDSRTYLPSLLEVRSKSDDGEARGAGIGGGYNVNCGNIIIRHPDGYWGDIGDRQYDYYGGIIKAIGGKDAAGIGGGYGARCGDITIVEGIDTVEATKGDGAPFSIGGGKDGSVGTIKIAGLKTEDVAPKTFTYPYRASDTYTVEFYKNDGSEAISSQKIPFDVKQQLKASTFARKQNLFVGWLNHNASSSNYFLSDEAIVHNLAEAEGTAKLYAQWDTFDGNLSNLWKNFIAADGDVLTGSLGGNYEILIDDGASVTLNNVSINADGRYSGDFAGLTCLGDCKIILADGSINTIRGFNENYPGIYVPKGKTLTIEGDGSLTATGDKNAAGIGCGKNMDCGNITISGGHIDAIGGEYAAGIGLGRISIWGAGDSKFISEYFDYSCGDITISGGTVNAVGGDYGAGIGFGSIDIVEEGANSRFSCGNITINGGIVNALGGQHAAAIGYGYIHEGRNAYYDYYYSCGIVSITDGAASVYAAAGDLAQYSIGLGEWVDEYYNSFLNNISIGTVTVAGLETGMIETTPFVFQTYDVAFASNGGDGSMEKQRFVYDAEPKSLAENSFTREGFDFVGWNTSDDGNGVAYDDLAEVQNLTDIAGGMVTLYAQWKRVLNLAAITIVEENNKWHATIDGQYDGKDAVEIAEEIVVNSVTFERTFSTDGYSTIVLPFDVYTDKLTGIDSVLSFEGIVSYEGKKAVGMNVVWERNFGRVKLQANTPYMLKMNESTLGIEGPVTLVPTEAAVTAVDGWELRGTYVYTAWPEGDEDLCRVYGFAGSSNDDIGVGEFVKFGAGSWLRPLRAYLINTKVTCDSKVRPAGAAARPVMASIEEELPDHMDVVILGSGTESEEHTTVIGRIDTRTGEFRMLRNYDLKGRNVQGKAQARGAYYGKTVLNK